MTAPRPELGFPRKWLYLIAGKLILITAVVVAVVVYSAYR
ncbi:hypothetical protein GCM10007923_45180 [Shinella yambaruensis]|uniref:Uncharacterized protein n=1 Tax=Shinella yambaruensis TaxID=415996 RepID=A0ABQ5ZL04_9HYPH|nr:hypothetical protein GCM10007923_45180 [Shinella yambaruensis]CAI0336932.1 conserved hypothetical protein [Rhizobiaceae bacterium]CAK7255459.1 conserved protein of unknown function [Shinella sp. WSC3-e]